MIQPQISIQINNYVDPLASTIQHPNQIYSPNNLPLSPLSPLSPSNQLTPTETIIYPPQLEESSSTIETSSPKHNKLSSIDTDSSSSTSSKNILSNDSDDNESDICAICLEVIDLEKNDSISSCSCKNKLHIDCLIKWIEYKDSIYCEICRTQYNIPHNVLLEYYNQQSQNVSVNESNDYYLNSYNNNYNYDNQDNQYNPDNQDNQDNQDSDLSDDNYEIESRNASRERRLYNELFLQRRRNWYITILCALLSTFIGGITILIYQYLYM